MANRICDLMDKAEGMQKQPCDNKCKHYLFDHLETACVLSEVYSVRKGEGCYIKELKGD